jgi:hypothetical protein
MSAEGVLGFLKAVDDELARHADEGETLELYLIGRSALILGYGLRLMTKDVDLVETTGSRLFTLAVEEFKKGNDRHAGHGFYLEAVSSGLPPMPIGFEKRCVQVPGPWCVIRLKRPDAHDLVVTKLKQFHAGDREDVQMLCDTGEVEIGTLRERFDLAHVFSDMDDPRVKAALANLDTVAEYLEGRRQSL